MGDNFQLFFPEEEEDLDALRSAALQSLKRKNDDQGPPSRDTFFNGLNRKQKRSKFRMLRNGPFNGARNSNLIAVPMVSEEVDKNPSAKLILPQDRYTKMIQSPDKSENISTKFDRYDNSDESDESDDDIPKTNELKRSNSLEALMAELENEIQGVGNAVVNDDKPKKKKRKIKLSTTPPKKTVNPPNQLVRKWAAPRHPNPTSIVAPPILPFVPPIVHFQPQFTPIIYNAPPPVIFETPPPPISLPPLPPLVIGGNISVMAPLSPRSAAFVMENRAIIEKRKRRSRSRSLTPPTRFRRSLSPRPLKRRSLSPTPPRKLPPKVEEPPTIVDPILEARRRKFERSDPITAGVIRLKKEEEEGEKKSEVVDEEVLLEGEDDNNDDDGILLDHKLDSLFSDEESDSDNEGRFKDKSQTTNKVAALPFTKLVSGPRRRSLREGKSPVRKRAKIEESTTNERKTEVKVRRPVKSERKVEVEEVVTKEVGDLRAQLSRKRAERQKIPLPDVVPSRLLQTALESVVGEKKKTKEESTDSKLSIRHRLGTTSDNTANKRKSNNKGSQEQV